MSDITIRQVEYFLAVIDQGSISAASKELHVSQAAVSMAIQQLETTLKAKLLTRSPARRATPTPAGDLFIPLARRVLASVQAATSAVQNDQVSMRGTLRVDVAASISPHVVPPLVSHFDEHHGQVIVEVNETTPADLYDRISKGRSDLGILYERQSQAELVTTRIAPVQPHVVVSADHRLAQRRTVRLAEIVDEPLIAVDIPPSLERISEAIVGLGLTPNIKWPSSNIETVRSMVALGLGWSYFNIVPASDVAYGGREVRYIPIVDPLPDNAVVAVQQHEDFPNIKVDGAVNFLRQYFKDRG